MKTKRLKNPIHSPEELANDPSLKWFPYRKYELVWSDCHDTELRFFEYENSKVRLATVNGMGSLPGLVERTSIRRPTALGGYGRKVES